MAKRGEKFTKICPKCGKKFECMKSNERKYCSKECSNKAKENGMDIQCDNCGKIFHRRQYHIDRQLNRGQNNFCCLKCQKEYLHKQSFEMRKCEVCGKEFEVSKINAQRFCSYECQSKWQSTRVGELNPNFLSIPTNCTYCGKVHYVKPYKFNEQKYFFCSKECRQAWYAEIYSQTDEWREYSRQKMIKQLNSGSITTDTEPQRIVNSILDDLDIQYKREEPFDFFTVDNFLPSYNLIIEVQGDCWHTNPKKFTSNITKVQYGRIGRDKSKHSFIKNQYGIEILYLWESDIISNKDLCRKLIQHYIDNNGNIKNYNSFNYSIECEKLLLNENIIVPYQDMPLEQYKSILNIAI